MVKAKTFKRFLGLTLSTTVEEYICPENEDSWYNIEGKKVVNFKKKQLDRWLKDHKRFIEHDELRVEGDRSC